jgi:GNAT superfamily N-acetyltransferase
VPSRLRLHQSAGRDRTNPELTTAIRNATIADQQAIARVHVDSWKETYAGLLPQDHLDDLGYRARESMWKALDPELTFVAEVDGAIVGFSNGGPERSGEPAFSGEVYNLYLLHAHQRRGLGQDLFSRTVGALGEKGLNGVLVWVLSANPSRAFFEHLGGRLLRSQPITIFGAELEEVAYGWPDSTDIRSYASES